MAHAPIHLSEPESLRSVNLCDVTVVIAAWNAAATLARAVNSALSQTDVSVEVVIIDDASDDGTLACARALEAQDARVVVLAQTSNQGPAAARNAGFAHARGRYITPLDSDDFMEPGRLRTLITHAEQGGWHFVADDLWQIDADAPPDTQPRRLFSDTPLGIERMSLRDFIRGNMSENHGGRREIGFLKPLMCRGFLERYALRYAENMRLGEDYDLYARALMRGARFCLTDPAGYVAVVRPDSLSGCHDAAALRALVQADDGLLRDPDLSVADARVVSAHRIETLKRWAWLELIESVRTREVRRGLRAFMVPVSVVGSLLGKLAEQVKLRGGARLKSMWRRAA